MRDLILVEVSDMSAAGEVRREAARFADHLDFDDEESGRLQVIATELATNIVKHATAGMMLIGFAAALDETVELLALDNGPGIADLGKALSDGHSTAGTQGTGLGAVSRMADLFQVYSRPKHGTAILSRVSRRDSAQNGQAAVIGGVSIPLRGERVNGDGWSFTAENGRRIVMVVDGLGHGYPAHDAAAAACTAFSGAKGSCSDRLKTIHEAIRSTRGAAVAVAELDPNEGKMRFAGVGNISATIIDAAARRSAVSMHGIAGHEIREVREFAYPWSRESSLIMHSDGLTTRWDLDAYPALLARDPALIAAILWKDHRRPNDDSTVVVARTP